MKLKAKLVPYSSVVGGGILLTDENGAARFQIILVGTTKGINKEQNDAICNQLKIIIDEHGLIMR